MSKAMGFLAFGIALISGGLFWILCEDIFDRYIFQYVRVTEYYYATDIAWHIIPFIIVIVGVICLIASGVSARRTTVVYQE